MGFDLQQFRKTKLAQPEGSLTLSELSSFNDGEPAVVTVRQLDSNELHHADNVVAKRKSIKAIIEQLSGGSDKEKAQAVFEAMGYGDDDDISDQLIKKIEHVRMALVSPEMDEADIVKLAKYYPVPFQLIHNKVMELTGQGGIEATVKRQPSGDKTA